MKINGDDNYFNRYIPYFLCEQEDGYVEMKKEYWMDWQYYEKNIYPPGRKLKKIEQKLND